MTRLIFVRHAETDMAGTFCGHSDPELNERGRAQLPGLIDRINDRLNESSNDRLPAERFHKLFTSDLARARQTAHAISSYFDVEAADRPGLREISFGEWEGLSWSEIEARDPVLAARWASEYPNVPAPAGETFPRFAARVRSETDFLLRQAAEGPIVVVTHAGFLRVALPRLYGPTHGGAQNAILEATPPYAAVVSVDTEALVSL